MRTISAIIGFCVLLFLAADGTHGCSQAAESIQNLHSFCKKPQCGDGHTYAPVSLDGVSTIFGAADGGPNGYGLVYKLAPQAGKTRWRYNILHTFCQQNGCIDGGHVVRSRLVIDVNGNVYGTTADGGTANDGTIFELSPSQRGGWTYSVIYNFCSAKNCKDGNTPVGNLTYAGQQQGLLYDGVSPLYGTTAAGGQHFSGVAFAIGPQGGSAWQENIVYAFCVHNITGCPDGSSPAAGMTMDVSGNLFGLTSSGGATIHGVAFKLAAPQARQSGPWTETVLHSFCHLDRCTDGVFTFAEPVVDGSGNFYGTTFYGGTQTNCPDPQSGCGLLYKIAADGTYTVLHEFCSDTGCADGAEVEDWGGMQIDASGNVYGTTVASAKGGLIFEYTSGGEYQVIYDFCARAGCLDGDFPAAGPTLDSGGHLFGTTAFGGKFQKGVAFELSP